MLALSSSRLAVRARSSDRAAAAPGATGNLIVAEPQPSSQWCRRVTRRADAHRAWLRAAAASRRRTRRLSPRHRHGSIGRTASTSTSGHRARPRAHQSAISCSPSNTFVSHTAGSCSSVDAPCQVTPSSPWPTGASSAVHFVASTSKRPSTVLKGEGGELGWPRVEHVTEEPSRRERDDAIDQRLQLALLFAGDDEVHRPDARLNSQKSCP